MTTRVYTELELSVLDRFFTGSKSNDSITNIYAVKSAMPSTIWALLCGSYSRSSKSLRDMFLDTIRDIEADRYEIVLEDLSIGQSKALDKFMTRAENFLSKWGVSYGHNSLKDSCVDRFAVENVSIVATKFIEWAQLGSYQEKSTRYCDFSKVEFISYFIEAHFRPEARSAFEKCREAYLEVFESAFNTFYSTMFSISDISVRERTARAKAFDIARYMLPVSSPTSLGITMSSRETERLISDMIGSPYAEAVHIGLALKECGQQVNPSLIKHVQANFGPGQIKRLQEAECSVAERFNLPKAERIDNGNNEIYNAGEVSISTVSEKSAFHPRWLSTASALIESNSLFGNSVSTLAEQIRNSSSTQQIVDYVLDQRGQHDPFPPGFGAGEIIVESFIDFGAYRDLQRHRRGHQFKIVPTNNFGYRLPDYVVHRPELLAKCESAISALDDVRIRLTESQASGSEYLSVLAHNVHFTYVASVSQLVYMIELRSTPQGHSSYRAWAQDTARCLIQAFPELAKHIRVNWEGETDRREQEQKVVQRSRSLVGYVD